jgi:predicted restriction endonuclease
MTDDEIDNAIRTNRLQIGIIPTDSQQASVRQRRGQARIHKLTVENYGGRCAVCDVTDAALLVATHIVGWAETPEHRGDLSNVICLCRIHDALFEVGYWSLGDNLELLKKDAVASTTIHRALDGIAFRSPLQYAPAPRFSQHHRARVGFA